MENFTLRGIVQDLFRQELNREVQNRPGYRADRIGPFKLILEPFIENGMMTQTLKNPAMEQRITISLTDVCLIPHLKKAPA